MLLSEKLFKEVKISQLMLGKVFRLKDNTFSMSAFYINKKKVIRVFSNFQLVKTNFGMYQKKC